MRSNLLALIGASTVIAAPSSSRPGSGQAAPVHVAPRPTQPSGPAKHVPFIPRILQSDKCLVFKDDFDTLRTSVWQHANTLRGGGNFEFEWYIWCSWDRKGNDPPSLCTGNAFFGCSRTSGNGNIINPIQSAQIRTAESVNIKFGRVEVRAKPKGDWIWLEYGKWPASGEIDIMESRGNVDYPCAAGAAYALSIPPSYSNIFAHASFFSFNLTHQTFQLPEGTFADDFHVFGLEWTAESITTYTYVDDVTVLHVPLNEFRKFGDFPPALNDPWMGGSSAAPFNQEFYLVRTAFFLYAEGGVNEVNQTCLTFPNLKILIL
ncbi:concanavalin A-like lectin/glucanase domain-containing protein [Blyttiomyces helicus]|uniref:Concanavalin A-like lectin/glucanase domain-containing protein n=1 Tax=Blyttiomyces helicus TaxID=388810 RepID=A0A4P9VXI1_9FUNG|nr:concanavalin A-like lectin/glucanase domain-containing protein [Blyttiomyces helicus]|eukprot:RKO84439.1 concanavalin A-like lectin/glucanase domain-containing protein [Blyttiomyces helicus]